jgi:hypothetical protein
MTREGHVRFWERVGVRFPCATRLDTTASFAPHLCRGIIDLERVAASTCRVPAFTKDPLSPGSYLE